MANKGLNIFGECAAKFVHHVPPEEHCSSCGDVNVHTWYHSKFTEDAKKTSAIGKVIILVEKSIL